MIPKPPFKVWLKDLSESEKIEALRVLKGALPDNYTIELDGLKKGEVTVAFVNSFWSIICFGEEGYGSYKNAEEMWDGNSKGAWRTNWWPPRKPTRIIDFNTVA